MTCTCGIPMQHTASCPAHRRETCPICASAAAPELSETEAAIVARFDAAPAAPESYVKQHTSNDGTCFCSPIQVGSLGTWTHRVVEP